jgi:hypothetical protein
VIVVPYDIARHALGFLSDRIAIRRREPLNASADAA